MSLLVSVVKGLNFSCDFRLPKLSPNRLPSFEESSASQPCLLPLTPPQRAQVNIMWLWGQVFGSLNPMWMSSSNYGPSFARWGISPNVDRFRFPSKPRCVHGLKGRSAQHAQDPALRRGEIRISDKTLTVEICKNSFEENLKEGSRVFLASL